MSVRHGLTRVEFLGLFVASLVFVVAMLPTAPASQSAREAALEDGLETLRTGIEMYRFEHAGRLPAEETSEPRELEAVLVRPSDSEGRVSPDGRYGPYVVGRIPANPFNGRRDVKIVTEPELPVPDDTTGWVYSTRTGRIAANTRGRTSNGRTLGSL